MDTTGMSAMALGNHEIDPGTTRHFTKLMQNAKFKILGINLHAINNDPIKKIIEKSYVEEKDGQRYGVIGISPPDLFERVKNGRLPDQIKLDDFDKTIADVQAQADEFKAQGINKIIVLSHAGLKKDQRLAQEISGVDVIIGGHSHELLEGVEEGQNLFYSKSGEPVVITQAGKDGEYAGVLNVEFDQNGVIKKVQNNISASKNFARSLPLQVAFNKILGPSEDIGVIKSAPPPPKNRLIEPNPHLYLMLDAMRTELDADIAMINAGNCRGFFVPGPVNSRKVFEITPFGNKIVTLYLNEKEIVDAIKVGAKSFIQPGNKPSIVQVSGLRYAVSTAGEVKSMVFVDKQGVEHPIDVNNPDPEKDYLVVTDNFVASGGDGLLPDKNAMRAYDQLFNFDKDKLACDYIKKFKEPIEIKDDGRITIV
jgi:5'-nucleotidase